MSGAEPPLRPGDADGGPLFDEPWQADAFAMTQALLEIGVVTDAEWTSALAAAISAHRRDGDPDLGDTYYEHWLAALEAVCTAKGLASPDEVGARAEEWRRAYVSTPHGRPVELSAGRAGATMTAVVTRGNGGFEMLQVREVPIPEPGPGEVRVRVLAAGVNNTEINTRLGWYSSSVTTSTDDASAAVTRDEPVQRPDGGWNATTPFPLIQGTDCCGVVDVVGDGADPSLVGRRILVRPCVRPHGFSSMENIWMGSDFDGAFAEHVVVPASEVFPVSCDWSDAELGSIPCAYGTAENMLHRAAVGADDDVLVTGASGGVGSAAVQLARRRGARVTAVASAAKSEAVLALGAGDVLDRRAPPPPDSFDVVVDNVAGPRFGAVLSALRRGGRYVSSGAIGGPVVELDMRSMYLRDIRLIGCTAWDEPVFPNLVGYIERGEIRPVVARTFPLHRIVDAQRELLERRHVGKLVLIP